MAQYAAAHDVTVYTISLGNEADVVLMQQIAEIAGGERFDAAAAPAYNCSIRSSQTLSAKRPRRSSACSWFSKSPARIARQGVSILLGHCGLQPPGSRSMRVAIGDMSSCVLGSVASIAIRIERLPGGWRRRCPRGVEKALADGASPGTY